MSHIAPRLRPQFDALSKELQAAILARDVPINTLHDLIGVLDALIRENE